MLGMCTPRRTRYTSTCSQRSTSLRTLSNTRGLYAIWQPDFPHFGAVLLYVGKIDPKNQTGLHGQLIATCAALRLARSNGRTRLSGL